jgi:hypothetical protein
MNSKQRSVLSLMVGSMLYIPVLTLNSWAGGQWLDINEIYFAPFVALSMFFIFASVAILNPRPLHYGIISTAFFFAMIAAIPNVAYPIGSSYYENLEVSLSRVSGALYAIACMLYCYVVLK